MGWRKGEQARPIVVGGVEFQPPEGPRTGRWKAVYPSVYFVALALWSAAASWHVHRVAGIVAALVLLELALAMVRAVTLASTIVYSDEMARRIAAPLQELCARVGCRPPRVVLRDTATRVACVRRGKKRVLLVLSEPFVRRVNDNELRALLAHEVMHVAHDDLSEIKARVWLTMILAVVVSVVIDVVIGGSFAFPVYVAIFVVVMMAVQAVDSPLNRRLERRADMDGAVLAGDPATLAAGLQAAHDLSTEARKQLYGPPWKWLLAPLMWRMPTHPPMRQRISYLEHMAYVSDPYPPLSDRP